MNRKLKHDINSLFFKMKTSIDLLKDDISTEERNLIAKILESNIDQLEIFCKTFFIDFKNLKKVEKIDLCSFFSNENKFYVISDRLIIEIFIKIIKYLMNNSIKKVECKENQLIIYGQIKNENELDNYLINFLNKASKTMNREITFYKNKVKIK